MVENIPSAAVIRDVLTYVDAHLKVLQSNEQISTFLRQLTADKKYHYATKSRESPERVHDEYSLLQTLRNIVRRHAVRKVKKDVVALFQEGSVILAPEYLAKIACETRKPSVNAWKCSSEMTNNEAIPHPRKRSRGRERRSRMIEDQPERSEDDLSHNPKRSKLPLKHNDAATSPVNFRAHTGSGDAEASQTPYTSNRATKSRSDDRGYKPTGATRDSLAETLKTVGISDDDIRESLGDVWIKLNGTVAAMFQNLGQDASKLANVALDPPRDLEQLYFRIFGTTEWKEVAVRLQSQGRLAAGMLLQSLISAFLISKIFTGDLPWDSPLDALNEQRAMRQYVQPLLGSRGIGFEKLLREAAMIQVSDKHFQIATVRPKAQALAQDLALTLNSHLEQHTTRPNSKGWHKGWHIHVANGLTDLCLMALILRGKMVASLDQYSIIWIDPEEAYQVETMDAMDSGPAKKVALCVFMGFGCRPADSVKWPATIPCRARVFLEAESTDSAESAIVVFAD